MGFIFGAKLMAESHSLAPKLVLKKKRSGFRLLVAEISTSKNYPFDFGSKYLVKFFSNELKYIREIFADKGCFVLDDYRSDSKNFDSF